MRTSPRPPALPPARPGAGYVVRSAITLSTIGRGDRVLVSTPGGGGYGPARARDRALLARDQALGYGRRGATRRRRA